jgi:hypothetical protein
MEVWRDSIVKDTRESIGERRRIDNYSFEINKFHDLEYI